MLIAHIVEPEPGKAVYDPACGSGGLLIKCHLRFLEKYGEQRNGARQLPNDVAPLKFYGQEINPSTFAMARINAFIHDMEAEIALGDTMAHPAFKDAGGRLQQFDIVVANPMWNQNFPTATYQQDPFERFCFGVLPGSSADWGWMQHMYASLKDGDRMAVVLDTGAISRGSGNQGASRERDIRKAFVDADLVEAVVLLPENLFSTPPHRASSWWSTAPNGIRARCCWSTPPIFLPKAAQELPHGRAHPQIAGLYHDWKAAEGLAAIVTKEELARNDYNLSPSRYMSSNDKEEVLPLEEAMVLLREAEEEHAEADQELEEVLQRLGLGGLRDG